MLANALRLHRSRINTRDAITLEHVDELIYDVALVCNANNRNFSYDRFYTACNYKGRDNE